ncbi:MAG: hypothetical protein AB7S68_29070 [Polyangiaceae bacterium]
MGRLDGNGGLLSTQFGYAKPGKDIALRALLVDAAGGASLTGTGSGHFDNVADSYTSGPFWARLNPDGSNGWVLPSDYAVGVVDSGYVVGGGYTAPFVFGGQQVPRSSGESVWFARVDSAGQVSSVHTAGSGAAVSVSQIVGLPDGSVWMLGDFNGQAQFGSFALDSAGAPVAFLLQLDANGQPTAAQTLPDVQTYAAVLAATGLYLSAGVSVERRALDGTSIWRHEYTSSEIYPGNSPGSVGRDGSYFVQIEVIGGLDIGCGPNPYGSQDTFVMVKFGPTGDILWVDYVPYYQPPTIGGVGIIAHSAIDQNGAVLLGASISGEPVIGGQTVSGSGKMVLLKYK